MLPFIGLYLYFLSWLFIIMPIGSVLMASGLLAGALRLAIGSR